MNSAISYEDVSLSFPAKGRGDPRLVVLDHVSFDVSGGEFVSVVGPSGCGKSTLLNLTAGLLHPSSGRVLFHDVAVDQVNTRVGYITQSDNLLPWQTTYTNVELALRIRHVAPAERRATVERWLKVVGLDGFADYYPRELSGGMRKRATLARTLCYDPDTILLDEPFGALDAQLRAVLQEELLRIWDETGKTMIFITHDLGEAIALSDRVVVLSPKPAHVIAERIVPLARPRVLRKIWLLPEFREMQEELWNILDTDIRSSDNV